jgi:hypothetical protein
MRNDEGWMEIGTKKNGGRKRGNEEYEIKDATSHFYMNKVSSVRLDIDDKELVYFLVWKIGGLMVVHWSCYNKVS